MGGIGHEDDAPPAVASRCVVGADDQYPRELALGAGRGLEAPRREAADLADPLLQRMDQLEGALVELLAERGWMFRQPGSEAACSSTLGLYFIVQEPSG